MADYGRETEMKVPTPHFAHQFLGNGFDDAARAQVIGERPFDRTAR